MNDWREVKLGDVADITRGASPRPINDYISAKGIPWIKIADATEDKSRFINKTKEYIIESGVSKSRYLKSGSFILSNSATPGLPKILNIDACVHDGWLIFDNLNKIDKLFLYYLLLSSRDELVGVADGSVFKNLKTDIVKNYKFLLPALEEQGAIAGVLEALDDKIESNRKQNETLESMAAAIFKSWFIDFEPFAGTIPTDWKKRKLGDFFPVVTGKKDANVSVKDGQYPFFSCSQGILNTNEFSFDADAILLAGNGDFNIKCYRGKFEAYQRTYVLIPYKKELMFLLFFAMKHFMNDIVCGFKGSVINYITKGMIEDFQINLPDDKELLSLSSIFSIIGEKIEFNTKESDNLAQVRDSLLPRLMSGALRIPPYKKDN